MSQVSDQVDRSHQGCAGGGAKRLSRAPKQQETKMGGPRSDPALDQALSPVISAPEAPSIAV